MDLIVSSMEDTVIFAVRTLMPEYVSMYIISPACRVCVTSGMFTSGSTLIFTSTSIESTREMYFYAYALDGFRLLDKFGAASSSSALMAMDIFPESHSGNNGSFGLIFL